MRARVGFDLLIVTDGQPRLRERIDLALSRATPGRVAVLMRERELPTRELVALGRALRASTDERGALLLVSDRIDIAQAIDADGVQLPELGFAPELARALLGRHALIGLSRHDTPSLLEAAARGADYATLSPVRAVEGKAPPLGIDGFARGIAGASVPVYALGCVRAEDVGPLLARGARGVAVMRAVLAADDPGLAARRLLDALARA
ncbi:MAG TPA: thiamine phosphate synthase [Polyangiales bacterium]|nr:thiamine phosphate synthase [Polyangiales bacterium]